MDFLKQWQNKHQIEEIKLTKRQFINLHHHDEYSIRAALGDVGEACDKALEYGQTHIAVTNYMELSGWVKQYFTCKEKGLIPIFGIEAYISNHRPIFTQINKSRKEITGTNFEGSTHQWTKNLDELTLDEKSELGLYYHALLYAKNERGFYNIIKLHNDAQMYGVYNYPRMTELQLSKLGNDIICVIPCPNGEIINAIVNNQKQYALDKYNKYKTYFDDVYLELAVEEDEEYIEYNNAIIQFAEEYDIPLIIGTNSHYLNDDDDAFRKLLKMRSIKRDKRHAVNVCPNMKFKSNQEIQTIYQKYFKNNIFTEEVYQKAIYNIGTICDNIESFEVDTSIKMPSFPNANKVLKEKTIQGLKDKNLDKNKEYIDRMEYELDQVIRCGFADYFLFLEDMKNFVKETDDLFLGSGRGSCCGCLVLYLLELTTIDPLKYNLLFERFLDASRLDEIISKGLQISGCFTGDTLVLTDTGMQKIQNIKIGQVVVCGDGIQRKVEKIWTYEKQIIRLIYDCHYFDCTENHRIYVFSEDEFKYKHAKDIIVGDYLVQDENTLLEFHQITKLDGIHKVYDLQIEEVHNYRICGKPINKIIYEDGGIEYLT